MHWLGGWMRDYILAPAGFPQWLQRQPLALHWGCSSLWAAASDPLLHPRSGFQKFSDSFWPPISLLVVLTAERLSPVYFFPFIRAASQERKEVSSPWNEPSLNKGPGWSARNAKTSPPLSPPLPPTCLRPLSGSHGSVHDLPDRLGSSPASSCSFSLDLLQPHGRFLLLPLDFLLLFILTRRYLSMDF